MLKSKLCRTPLCEKLFQSKTYYGVILAMCLLASVVFVTPACGQEFRASITGQVADATGAVIPGATVTAVEVDTQVKSTTKSNSKGVYSLLYLLPGTYTVTATKDHFQTMVYRSERLDSGQQLGLNIALKTGNVSQEVTVTAGSVTLDTVSASMGGVVPQQRVENMPSTGREVFDDADFVQGSHIVGVNSFNNTLRNNGTVYAISGEQTDENIFYINGFPASDLGSWYISPNQNAVAQVQVSVMPYDAQYGRTGGGVLGANVKGGTNRFHGSIYDFFGNRALNANTSINDLSGLPKSADYRNTYGGAFGGPIQKGKTFFFGSYEGFRQSQPGTEETTVPTDAMKQGNFAGTGYTVYDPTSTTCKTYNTSGGCTQYTRTAFQNDAIPSQMISSIGQAILGLYPEPNRPGYSENYVVPSPNTYAYDQYVARLDEVLSDSTRMYGMFMLQNDGATAAGNTFSNAAYSGTDTTSRYWSVDMDVSHVFSPKMVLDAKATYGHNYGITTTGVAVGDNYLASKLGFDMPMVDTTSHQNVTPTFSVTNNAGLFGNTANGTANAFADFSGSVTQQLARHSLHYGVEFMDIQQSPTGVLGQPNGAFSFGLNFSQQNPLKAATGSGNSIADVLMGFPTSGSLSWDTPTFITMHYYGAFIQDTWQVLPSLTLSGGLRWDINTSPRDRHDRINAGFCQTCTNPYTSEINYANASTLQDPLLGGLQFAGVNGLPSAPFKNYWNDWQPRVGFSWAALSNTVVRGGYGIFFPWAPVAVDNIGFSQSTSYTASLDGNLTPSANLNSGTPYPAGAIAPTGATLGLQTNAGNSISYNNTNRRLRMTQHWSLDVQRKLPWGLLMDLGYLGNNVHAIPVTQSLDVVSTALQQACNLDTSICNTNVSNPFHGVLASNTTLGASATIPHWELERAFPLFSGVSEQRVPAGSSHFNSLALRVERRVHTLNFAFNYAYSNWRDRDSYLNSGNFQDADPISNLDANDIRNVFTLNAVYPLPSTDKRGPLGVLLNGWVFASTLIHYTGTPLSLPAADFSCSSLLPTGGQTRAHWFNNDESCWSNLGPWERRTLPLRIGYLRNPAITQWNPAIHKRFALWRETTAEFQLEALNGANHPTFGGPREALSTPASYSPSTNWVGFGTLPTEQNNVQRRIMASLQIDF
jgi:hypothetical protein